MGYYMAQVKKVKDGYRGKCEICGPLTTWTDKDDALDEAADHDTMHGYDGEADED